MNETIKRFPLQWPTGWKRTDLGRQIVSSFGKASVTDHGWRSKTPLSIAAGDKRVREELRRFGIPSDDIVVSTNLRLKLDGTPYSDQAQPKDPGVAVYWRDGDVTRTMAIDRYNKVQDNLAAVAATIEAMRAIERHGGAVILERAFTGFAALPAPGGATSWRSVLGIRGDETPTQESLKNIYRSAASTAHPDRGGSSDRMSAVNNAYEQAQRELGHV